MDSKRIGILVVATTPPAPEMMALIEPAEAEAVVGSRMLDPGGTGRCGMPGYEFVGNRILTTVQNVVAGTALLSEGLAGASRMLGEESPHQSRGAEQWT
jgi:hypothetical protein